MPRDILILSDRPPDVAALVRAGSSLAPTLGLRASSDGAVVQLCDSHGVAVLTMQHPVVVEVLDEVRRLVPSSPANLAVPLHWTEAWAPWGRTGDIGVTIALRLAQDLGGFCTVEDAS
jgi:hypothetical protein